MGRRQAEAWPCCEILMDFRFSLGIFGRCLRSSWRVLVRLEEQDQTPVTAALAPGP